MSGPRERPLVPAGCGRGLLLPGEQPAQSHLGVTMLRHLLGAAVRYALYQLGLPMPEKSPLRIVALRPYIDAAAISAALAPLPGGGEVLAALVDPGGAMAKASELLHSSPRLAVAASLHRWRLRFAPLRRRPPQRRAGADWATLRQALTAAVPSLGDACLAELVEVLERRRQRGLGASPPASLGHAACCFFAGRPDRAASLGTVDVRLPSWAEAAPIGAPPPLPSARRPHPLRGGGRETLRLLLNDLRPIVLALAERATASRVLDRPDDAFFLPFEVAHHLETVRRPRWLDAAVASNRAEHCTLEGLPVPVDGPAGERHLADRLPAPWSPLQPLL